MNDLDIIFRSPGELKPRLRAFRTHPDAQIDWLCTSITMYGFNQPVAIDAEGRIVCGAALVEAAKRLGLNRIPVICLAHLNEVQLRAYAIAVNKLADMAGYDDTELAIELADIQQLIGAIELPEFGIDTPELDRLLGLANLKPFEDEQTDPEPGPAFSRSGELWWMGRHAMVIGTALERTSHAQLMQDELAQSVVTDVPYNLPTSNFSTTGRFGDFAQGAGEMSSGEYVRFLTTAMRHVCEFSEDGSLHLWFMSHHFLLELLRAGAIAYTELKTIITWVKPFPGLGSLWRSRSEFIAAFKHGSAPHRLHANRRNRSTVWQYDSLSTFQPDRDELLSGHPSTKNSELIADAVLDTSDRDGIVLDPFAGSGTLALACETTGRRARMVELDPKLADVTLRRFRKATGIEPVTADTGETLAQREEQITSLSPVEEEA